MELRKNIKKILALGAGASMVGATMLGAMAAANLADYPMPFVKDGKFNGVLVVGDKAAAEDVIGVSDIAVSLQFAATKKAASGTGTVTLSGDSLKIESAGDVLEINEHIGNVTESLTDSDTTALKSYQVSTDKGTTDVNQYLRFKWGTTPASNNLQNGYADGRVVYAQNDDEKVADWLYFKDGNYAFQYELEFETGYESDLTGTGATLDADDLEDQTLSILGQEFEVTKATVTTANKVRLEMMGGALSDTFKEGETKTYTVNGKEYEVTNSIITDTGTIYAKFVVNGETTDKLSEGSTDILKDGTVIGVNDILPNEAGDVTSDLVEVFFGANRIIFEDTTTGATTTDGSVEINSETIEDGEVNIDFTNTGNTSVKINKITYTLNIDGKGGDEPYIASGKGLREYLDEPQGMLNDNWDIKYQGLTTPGTSKIKISNSGDDEYRLSFTNTQGIAYNNVKLLYANGANLIFGDDTDSLIFQQVSPAEGGLEGSFGNYTIQKNDQFVVCHACRSKTGVSRVLKFDNVDTSNNELQLSDVGTGSAITAIYTPTTSTNTSWGYGSFNVGGYSFDFNVTVLVGSSGKAAKKLYVDLDDDGTLGGIGDLVVNGGGWIDLNYVGLAEYNVSRGYRVSVPTGNVTLSINTITTNFDEAPSANEVFYVNFTSASSVIDLSIPSNAAAGLSPVTPDYDDNLNLGMTNYGVTTSVITQTSDPDTGEINYPLKELLGQVFVTFGTTTASTASSGDAVVIQKIEVGATKLASEVSDVKAVNAILVGGPCANAAAAEVMGNPTDCTEGFEQGSGMINLYDHGNGKVAMLIAGYSAADTRNAAAVVANYKDYALTGTKVKVSRVNNALTVTS